MLKPNKSKEIPEVTSLMARAAFPSGNIFLTLRDELGVIFEDEEFAELYSATGQPAESPAMLAMVTVMQYVENLTDRQAADAVRGRIDWKYALGLELSDAGFHYSVLSEFRQRLVEGGKERILLEKMLDRCREKELLNGKIKQRTDSTHILGAIRTMTLVELVGESMRHLLEELAIAAPEWLKEQIQPAWIKRYGRRFDSYRLPKSKDKQYELAVLIGQDGYALLQTIYGCSAPKEVVELPMVKLLRKIWVQQFYLCDGEVHWRTKKQYGQPPAGCMIASFRDLDAKYCVKRNTEWTGYKVHITETCQEGHPHLITQVETTPATVHDVKVTEKIQDDLKNHDLLPEIQLVDEGYMEADLLISSQEKGVDLFGPVPSSKSWQDREEDAFDHTQFQIDWENMVVTCPNGKTNASWSDRKTWRGTPNLTFVFSQKDCLPCPLRPRCTRAKNVGRTLTIYPQEKYEALLQARERQTTEAFKEMYGKRAGIEGTISQGVRKFGMRRSRYLGLAKTHLQHVATAAAINVDRIFTWLSGERPGTTPVSHFLKLAHAT
jgi:transposase